MTMEMLDTQIETKITEDGKAQVRMLFSVGMVADLKFEAACRDFAAAERAFNEHAAKMKTENAPDVCRWFDLLEERYLSEKRVWTMFCGEHRDLRTGLLYLQFRAMLLEGRPLRANA